MTKPIGLIEFLRRSLRAVDSANNLRGVVIRIFDGNSASSLSIENINTRFDGVVVFYKNLSRPNADPQYWNVQPEYCLIGSPARTKSGTLIIPVSYIYD